MFTGKAIITSLIQQKHIDTKRKNSQKKYINFSSVKICGTMKVPLLDKFSEMFFFSALETTRMGIEGYREPGNNCRAYVQNGHAVFSGRFKGTGQSQVCSNKKKV